jgi:HK97 family phage major capsid protein
MSDETKVLSLLDKVETNLNDYQKSHKAEMDSLKNGVEETKKHFAEMRAQNQELAQLVKNGIPKQEKDHLVEFGKAIQKSFVGRAASEGTAADGGYSVADEFATTVRSAQNKYGLVRQIFGSEIYPMKSDVCYVPTDTYEETSGNTPVPVTKAENTQISESDDAQMNRVTLTAGKYSTLNYISAELIEDTFIVGGFTGAYLMPKLARQKSKIEDTLFFTNATTGLLNSSSILSVTLDAGKTKFSDVTFDDLLDAQSAVVDDADVDGMFIMHKSIVNAIRKKKGLDGQYLWTPASAGEPSMILGYPFAKGSIMPKTTDSSQADTGFMLYGDVKLGCIFGERNQMRLDSSKDFRFDYDQIAVRMIFRVAMGTNSDIGRALCVIKTPAA